MSERTPWISWDLSVVDEPLILALLKYRQKNNRYQIDSLESNLISSMTYDGKHMPIIDLDFPHHYVPSTHEGHGHLYLDRAISRWRWVILMIGLYIGRQIELGYFIWSLRRGANFVRIEGVDKQPGPESGSYTYGWFRKLKK